MISDLINKGKYKIVGLSSGNNPPDPAYLTKQAVTF